MDQRALKRASKLMSLILRHQAREYGLMMDPEGYVLMTALLAAMRPAMPIISPSMIEAVVEQIEPHKQRFLIAGPYIRANYGHSLADRVRYPVVRPPDRLYHGTALAALDNIRRDGLLPMLRQFVHLTDDPILARQIGSRHGNPVVITIAAAEAHAAGTVFYSANSGFWLVAALSTAYFLDR
jgi:putative RNA 2'-phosphotransferase